MAPLADAFGAYAQQLLGGFKVPSFPKDIGYLATVPSQTTFDPALSMVCTKVKTTSGSQAG